MDLTPSTTDTTQTPHHTSFTNGSLKRRHDHSTTAAPSQPPFTVVSYKECLRNHAASLGGHALDGCGEFMPSSEPSSLTCAACGCHRNFHRRGTQEFPNPTFISFYPSALPHRGVTSPSPSQSPSLSPSASPSPPPLSHHFPPSYHRQNPATHVLLALGNACSDEHHVSVKAENPNGRKRHRTKFSKEQKEKMHEFSARLGWRMPNSGDDEGMVQEFCNSIGVSRGVFKVWMHNNKNNNTSWNRSSQMGNAPPPPPGDEEKINGN